MGNFLRQMIEIIERRGRKRKKMATTPLVKSNLNVILIILLFQTKRLLKWYYDYDLFCS